MVPGGQQISIGQQMRYVVERKVGPGDISRTESGPIQIFLKNFDEKIDEKVVQLRRDSGLVEEEVGLVSVVRMQDLVELKDEGSERG